MKFYFFEVLNYDKLIDGTAEGGRPLLKEKGPYTYREDREKKELNWTDSKEYLAFGQYKSYTFLPNESCEGCSPTDEGLSYQMVNFIFHIYNHFEFFSEDFEHACSKLHRKA